MKTNYTPSFDEEKIFWDQNIEYVAGIDEVGRGCFAGPVVVGGVIFNPCYTDYFTQHSSEFEWLHLIHDSKLLSQITREALAPLIKTHSLYFSIVEISVPTINALGIGKATFMGMQQVLTNLHQMVQNKPLAVLVDAFTIPDVSLAQKPIIKGDQKSVSIAAASIIAKVYRDALMTNLSQEYSGYNFAKNKGYGTQEHRVAIKNLGLSSLHRTSFDLGKYV